MNSFGLTFHHFGLAVRSPEKAFAYLEALGYSAGDSVLDPLQKVNLAMQYHDEMPDVEVIWPGDESSPIDSILKRNESLIYHLCYTSADAQASVASMKAAGFAVMPTTEPRAALLFGGVEVSFYYIDGFGLIELIHGEPTPSAIL
ncbi:MAG: VOC family protein [Candidatus Electrothrix sp. AX2]|nr:VOC family protein [Candidatus Electrothrix gigas]